MVDGLRALGGRAEAVDDGFVVTGSGGLDGGTIDAAGDHRIAMSASVAGQMAAGAVVVDDCDNVATSFPGFVALARSIGFSLSERTAG